MKKRGILYVFLFFSGSLFFSMPLRDLNQATAPLMHLHIWAAGVIGAVGATVIIISVIQLKRMLHSGDKK